MNSNLSQLIANRQFAKRRDARRELFAKVQQAADTEQIAWEEALRKVVLTPENAELLKLAQEPRRQRRARQRLSDAELERRMRQLGSAFNNTARRLDPTAARAARLSLGLTQANVAAQLGRTQAYYGLWEHGLRPLRPDELRLLQAILSATSTGGGRGAG
jgi:DNA-binding transcriptional regulator YiaG